MNNEKVKEVLSNIFGYIVILVTCVLYILTAIFALNPTGKTIWQIIGDSMLVLAMAITMDRLFSMQGIINGTKSKSMNSTMVLYGDTVEKINENINLLGEWCHRKNKKTYIQQRTKILSRAGLRYEDCFDEEGITKPYKSDYEEKPIIVDKAKLKNKSTRKTELVRIKNLKRENKELKREEDFRNKCYWQAINLKLSELYPNDLTSEGGKRNDPNNLGPTVKNYLLVDSIKAWITKLAFAVILGVYGITLIANFSYLELIWRAFQICLFTVLGIVKMKQSTMFITNEYRGRIIKKIDNLEEFQADLKLLMSDESITETDKGDS